MVVRARKTAAVRQHPRITDHCEGNFDDFEGNIGDFEANIDEF